MGGLIRSEGLWGQHQEDGSPAELGSVGICRRELVQQAGLAPLWVMSIVDILN